MKSRITTPVSTSSLAKTTRAAALTLAFCASVTTISWAQREPKPDGDIGFIVVPAPEGMNGGGTLRTRPMTPHDFQRLQEEMKQLQQMTPDERQRFFEERMQEENEHLLREALEWAGLNELPLQDTVIAFIREQEAARVPLRKQRQRLIAALRDRSHNGKEAQQAIVSWRKATQAVKEHYATALKELDAKIEYSKKPRLEALLTTLGLLDDSSFMAGGPLIPGALHLLQPSAVMSSTAMSSATATDGSP